MSPRPRTRPTKRPGSRSAPEATDVVDILFDLTRRETRTFSHAFQHTLAGYWQKIARLNRNPERSAGFKVLQAPDVPSVLLELGYLSSEKDVAALTSADWRDKATGSIAASIDAFFVDTLAGPGGVGHGHRAAGREIRTRPRLWCSGHISERLKFDPMLK